MHISQTSSRAFNLMDITALQSSLSVTEMKENSGTIEEKGIPTTKSISH
jgi:hypothetical protein